MNSDKRIIKRIEKFIVKVKSDECVVVLKGAISKTGSSPKGNYGHSQVKY